MIDRIVHSGDHNVENSTNLQVVFIIFLPQLYFQTLCDITKEKPTAVNKILNEEKNKKKFAFIMVAPHFQACFFYKKKNDLIRVLSIFWSRSLVFAFAPLWSLLSVWTFHIFFFCSLVPFVRFGRLFVSCECLIAFHSVDNGNDDVECHANAREQRSKRTKAVTLPRNQMHATAAPAAAFAVCCWLLLFVSWFG